MEALIFFIIVVIVFFFAFRASLRKSRRDKQAAIEEKSRKLKENQEIRAKGTAIVPPEVMAGSKSREAKREAKIQEPKDLSEPDYWSTADFKPSTAGWIRVPDLIVESTGMVWMPNNPRNRRLISRLRPDRDYAEVYCDESGGFHLILQKDTKLTPSRLSKLNAPLIPFISVEYATVIGQGRFANSSTKTQIRREQRLAIMEAKPEVTKDSVRAHSYSATRLDRYAAESRWEADLEESREREEWARTRAIQDTISKEARATRRNQIVVGVLTRGRRKKE